MGHATGRGRGLQICATLAAIAAGLALHWPSVDLGFRGDDYVQGAMLRGTFPVQRSPLDLFDFASGELHDDARLRDFGYLPWWSVPDVRLRMWRPLASALLAHDHRAFGWHARPMHLHSLGWFVLLLGAASLLLFELLPPTAAASALGLFAVQPCHVVPIAWLANRNTLIASALGFLAVAAYVRARERSRGARARYLAAACAFASMALLAGEYAFGALAFAFAYELVRPRAEPLRLRWQAFWPLAALGVAYLVLHTASHSDVSGSGFYLSPTREPLAFARAALLRAPVLLADSVLGLPSAYFNFGSPLRAWLFPLGITDPWLVRRLPDWTLLHAGAGFVAVIVYLVLLRAALARCAGERERRGLTCLGVGALVSLVPVAGSLPGDRLLIATSLGVCAVIACLVARVGRSLARHVLLSAVLLGALGVHAGQRTHQQVAIFRAESEALRIWALDADLPRGEEAADDRVYVIASADFTTAANLPWLRRAHGLPTARSYRRLCPSASALELTRVDDRALDLTLLTLDRNDGAVPSLYRSLANPLRAGDTFSVPGLTVRVLLMRGETPSRMRFTFDRSLDDAHLVFLQSTPRGLRRVTLPALGQRVRMARPVMRDLRYAGLGPRDPATE